MTEQDERILDDLIKALEQIFARRRLSQLTRFKNEIVKIDEMIKLMRSDNRADDSLNNLTLISEGGCHGMEQ